MIGEQDIYSEPVIMLACPEWNTGVIGIAAAKDRGEICAPAFAAGRARAFDRFGTQH